MPSPIRFRPTRRSILVGGAALGVLPLLPRRARAAEWPTRPVKLVVPFAAGGTTDILARVVAAKVSEEFGQQFIVENKAGAGGNIAADAVAKAEPDGYTFIVGTPGTHAINQFVFKNMTYDQIKDIAPVIIIARVPNLCSVANALPVKSVAELIAYAKSKPGELFYGTPGLGSTAHLSTELFKSMTGVDMTHVTYKGSAGADRPDRGPRPGHDRQSAGGATLRRRRPDPPARGFHGNALAAAAGDSDHCGGRRARLRGGVVVHHRRAGEDAEGDHQPAQCQRR
jgi:hypothetical protein